MNENNLEILKEDIRTNIRKVFVPLLIVILLVFGFNLKSNYIRQDGAIAEIPLNNDLDILLKPTNSPLVSVQAWVRCGTLNENPQTNGMSHLVEHLLFKRKSLVEAVENRGGYFNAATSYDFTYYYIVINRQDAGYAVKLLMELVLANSFQQEEVNKEKQVVLEEIAASEDDPDNFVYDYIINRVYGKHPYGQRVLGTRQNIQNFSLRDINDYYRKYYQPNNVTLVVTGGIEKKKLLRQIDYLEDIPRGVVPIPISRAEEHFGDYSAYVKKLTVPKYYIVYSVPGVTGYDSHVLDILSYWLGNRTNAVLNKRLKEELGLVYSVNVAYQTRKQRSLFIIEMPLKTMAVEKLKREYNRLLENSRISEVELNLIKAKISKDYYLDQEKIEDTGFGLGYYNSIDSYKYDRDYLLNINKVTVKDIENVINKYFVHKAQFLFIPG